MHIGDLDPRDDVAMADRYAVCVAVRTHDRPHYLPRTLEDDLADVRRASVGLERVLWGIWDRDLIGVVTLGLPEDRPEAMSAHIEILPERRRRGSGARALAAVMTYAAQRGRRRVVGTAHYPPAEAADHAHRVFLEHNGFLLVSSEPVWALALPARRVLLDGLAAQALAAYFDSYRVDTHEWVPDALIPSLCELANRAGIELATNAVERRLEPMDPTRYAAVRADDAAAGRDRLTTVAVEAATEQVVGFTELLMPPGITRAVQRVTYVHPAHRGRRLGAGMMVANVIALQEEYPERRDVHTELAVASEWGTGLSESIGYRPIELAGLYYRDV